MVALRDTHEATFDFEQWATGLNLPAEQKVQLQKSHDYAVQCIARKHQKDEEGKEKIALSATQVAVQAQAQAQAAADQAHAGDKSTGSAAGTTAGAADHPASLADAAKGAGENELAAKGKKFKAKSAAVEDELNDRGLTNLSAEIISILMSLNMDIDSLMVAFLYPAFEQHALDLEDVEATFGVGIKKLLLKVRDMEAIRFLQNNESSENQVDLVRRMLLSMVDDVRAIVIKLAERIAVIRAAKYADEETKLTIAREIANIYAPLANRLGIGQLKWELEDLAFRFLHNDYYKEIAKDLGEKRVERERYIESFVNELKTMLQQNGINAEVYGRPKHIYSIWRKMQRKHLPFSEMYDVRAVRVVVHKIEECYTALSLVHSRWEHIDKEFDDYIANPKPNGYQSIHTVVYGDGHKVVEVQFRTEDMHNMAELGVAAHWKYKEGGGDRGSGVEQRINWLRKLLAWRDDMVESGSLLEEYRKQVFEDRVYVFTPQGQVMDLQAGATPLDFAYQIHTMIGHRCIGAKVDGRIVPYTYVLKTGDQVEIITQKDPNPSREWLNADNGYLKTSRARSKVMSWFRKQEFDQNYQAGVELIEHEVSRKAWNLSREQIFSCVKASLSRFNLKTVEDVFANVGSNAIKPNQIMNLLEDKIRQSAKANKVEEEYTLQSLITHKEELTGDSANKKKNKSKKAKKTKQDDGETKNSGILVVNGVDNMLNHIAKCCRPLPGDAIVGFVTQGRGISIHKSDCPQLKGLVKKNPERMVVAEWGDSAEAKKYNTTVRIEAVDYSGLLRDVSEAITNERINVTGVRSHTDNKTHLSVIEAELDMVNLENLDRLLIRLNAIRGVRSAIRV